MGSLNPLKQGTLHLGDLATGVGYSLDDIREHLVNEG
ncbi:hypothetical protein BKA01_004897 [Pseudonocardia eucalypti]|nr:hypothetical protein [Pseudonocardia eucalypti]